MSKKKKYRNNDEDPKIFSYFPHIAISALVFFGVSLGVGLSKGIEWLTILGIVVLCVTISAMKLSQLIWFFWTLSTVMKEKDEQEEREKEGKPSEEEEYKQFSEFRDCDDDEEENVDKSEIAKEAKRESPSEIVREEVKPAKTEEHKTSSSYHAVDSQDPKNWSPSDKAKVYSVVFPLVITLLVFMAGIFTSNLGILSIGYPLMGAGGGGFALIIIILIIVSNVQEKRRSNPRSKRKRSRKPKDRDSAPIAVAPTGERRPTEILRRGTVVYCEIENARGRKRSAGESYRISVSHGEAQKVITLSSSKQYQVGDTVKFYQSCDNPTKGRLAEND